MIPIPPLLLFPGLVVGFSVLFTRTIYKSESTCSDKSRPTNEVFYKNTDDSRRSSERKFIFHKINKEIDDFTPNKSLFNHHDKFKDVLSKESSTPIFDSESNQFNTTTINDTNEIFESTSYQFNHHNKDDLSKYTNKSSNQIFESTSDHDTKEISKTIAKNKNNDPNSETNNKSESVNSYDEEKYKSALNYFKNLTCNEFISHGENYDKKYVEDDNKYFEEQFRFIRFISIRKDYDKKFHEEYFEELKKYHERLFYRTTINKEDECLEELSYFEENLEEQINNLRKCFSDENGRSSRALNDLHKDILALQTDFEQFESSYLKTIEKDYNIGDVLCNDGVRIDVSHRISCRNSFSFQIRAEYNKLKTQRRKLYYDESS
ncbi:3006_t:CDS:2, partial [Gigaspora margarita]